MRKTWKIVQAVTSHLTWPRENTIVVIAEEYFVPIVSPKVWVVDLIKDPRESAKSAILCKPSKHTEAKINFLSRNYQEFDVWKMWSLWKMRLWKCEFCVKRVPKNVNFVKNEGLKLWILWKNATLKMWILWKMRVWNCDFVKKWDFEIVNFVK